MQTLAFRVIGPSCKAPPASNCWINHIGVVVKPILQRAEWNTVMPHRRCVALRPPGFRSPGVLGAFFCVCVLPPASAWVHSESCAKKDSHPSTRLRVSLHWPICKDYFVPILSRQLMEAVLPADAHQLATDRLYVSITNVKSGKNQLVSRFSSKDELITVCKPPETFNLCHWHTFSIVFTPLC